MRDFIDYVVIYKDGTVGNSYKRGPDGKVLLNEAGGVLDEGVGIGKIGLDGKFIDYEGYRKWAEGKSPEEIKAMQDQIAALGEKNYADVMGGEPPPGDAAQSLPGSINANGSTSQIIQQAQSYVGNYAALERKMWADVEVQVPLAYEAALLAEYGPEYADYQASLTASQLTGLGMVSSSTGEARTPGQIIQDYQAAYLSSFMTGWHSQSKAQSKALAQAVANGTEPSAKIELPAFQGGKVSW